MADPRRLDSPPLNLQPRGLLDFFGIKNGQWGPRTLSSELVPVLDLWRHYVATNCIDLDSDNVVLTDSGAWLGSILSNDWLQGAPAVVPQDEIWYFDSLTILGALSPGAGSTVWQLTARSSIPGGVLNAPFFPMTPLPQPVVSVASATQSVGFSVSMLYPFWMRPGTSFEFLYSAQLAATETLAVRAFARVARLRI